MIYAKNCILAKMQFQIESGPFGGQRFYTWLKHTKYKAYKRRVPFPFPPQSINPGAKAPGFLHLKTVERLLS